MDAALAGELPEAVASPNYGLAVEAHASRYFPLDYDTIWACHDETEVHDVAEAREWMTANGWTLEDEELELNLGGFAGFEGRRGKHAATLLPILGSMREAARWWFMALWIESDPARAIAHGPSREAWERLANHRLKL